MKRPIICIDTETTGVDICHDRIVQLCASKIESPGATPITKTILINPGIPIPATATEIHGITDEMVKDCGQFKQYARGIFEFFLGCDFAGFNIIGFDVPMIAEEFARCGITWPFSDTGYYDAMHVFKSKERRDLATAVLFYTGKEHAEAHDAQGDVTATWEVIEGQMKMYEDLHTFDEYAAFCHNPKALDLAGKIELNDNGEAIYTFGKNKGERVVDQRGFAEWMLKNSFSTNTKNVVKALLNKKP